MTVRVDELAAGFHDAFDMSAAMAAVEELCRHDRYQASAGLREAAAWVAAAAKEAGLADVELMELPADGARHWWTFHAPAGWTPRAAELRLDGERLVAYPEEPYRLAANSRPTGPGGVRAPLACLPGGARLAGAVAVHDGERLPLARALTLAEQAGCAGVVTAAPRVELPAGSRLFAFSVPPRRLAALAGREGAMVEATVSAELGGTMPLVTGRLPGALDEEVLLLAHLCHPRPSANDNASGAAALLGVASTLAGWPAAPPRRYGVRFLWGPEFAGTAAFLHQRRDRLPVAAVNVDMAGEDQRRCGGPLVVERCPDHLPSWLSAVAERAAAALPQAARSYSGAVACDTWSWRATPFVGASDHSLLVDRSVGCPAVALGHWPDRFNHTPDDTVDKVDPGELRRTATVAGVTAALAAGAGPDAAPAIEEMVAGWAAARLLECLPGARAHPAPAAHGTVDPHAPGLARALLRHRAAVAAGALAALDPLDPGGAGRRGELATWAGGLAGHHAALLPPAELPAEHGPVLRPAWPGPFNLRGLAAAAEDADRAWLEERLALARGRGYALMLALAHALDGERPAGAVLRAAAFASELPVPVAFGERFLDVLRGAGWAEEVRR